MPLSGLDPSMLIGFFCRDESDWKDFRKKVEEVSIMEHSHSPHFFTDLCFFPSCIREIPQDHPLDQRRTTELAFG